METNEFKAILWLHQRSIETQNKFFEATLGKKDMNVRKLHIELLRFGYFHGRKEDCYDAILKDTPFSKREDRVFWSSKMEALK